LLTFKALNGIAPAYIRDLITVRKHTRYLFHFNPGTILFYVITQVILAFLLVPAYDLLEDRCTIDVIITKFFPLCFKMAESFENLDNILHDSAKDKYKKSIVEALNRYKKQSLAGKRKTKPFLS